MIGQEKEKFWKWKSCPIFRIQYFILILVLIWVNLAIPHALDHEFHILWRLHTEGSI